MLVQLEVAGVVLVIAAFIAYRIGQRSRIREAHERATAGQRWPAHPAMNRQGYEDSQPGVDTYRRIQTRLPRAKHGNQPDVDRFPADTRPGDSLNDLAGGDGTAREQKRALVRPSVRRSHPQPGDLR